MPHRGALNRVPPCGVLVQLGLIFFVLLSSCSQSEPSFTCTDSIGCVTVAPGEPVKIGVLQALSGKVAPLGQAQLRGLELALDKRKNTLFGHSIVLQIEDTGCTQEGGANAALKVIADPQTVAIFGSTCSSAAATASQAMSAAGLTMISGNNSAPFLTSIAGEKAPNWHAGFFRTASNEENAGKTAADYVFLQLGLKKAAIIHDNDIYTRGLTESFKQAFSKLGGEIVLDTAINKGETEMEPVLTAVINSAAQVLFFPLFQPEGNNILLQSRALPALNDTLLISGGALIEKSFLTDVGEIGKGMCFVGPSSPEGAVVDRLSADYEMKFKEQPTVDYYLSGYDAAALLFHAIEQVAIQEKDGTLHLGRKALRDKLYATTGFKGVTGTLNCNQFGDCAQPAFNVLRLDDPSQGLKGLQANKVFSSILEN
ncbi:MAG: ABC transporter substrate-binding protein [Desulfobulbaceae bacterium]|nr:ABC transporter substrate-binding protein [Desulfobulbaceae bacterium]